MTRGRIIAASVVTVVVGLILLLGVRVEATFAVSWAILVGILVLCGQLALPEDLRTDAPEMPMNQEQRGTEIARMAWSLNPRTGEAGVLITRRVRGILHHRLLRRGVDTEDPAHRAQIDALVGGGLWERLNGPGTKREDIERALAAIEILAPSKEKQ
ncbi:hypothetical protein [Microbacterium sp.]|uniref:hypothetical protein n=1 Tax=Microbacterium sp. TaxID=51671 RepID=UPI003F9C8787